ncbi:MAG: hypothetical protein LBD99_07305 [Candidatus Margulisbacteria bacterium]|jgi:hypothetical protein|nr:hypothetical protein [Candidatus Margulisiibacteriota bacterium]
MRKITLLFLALVSLGSAALRLQGQAGALGYGFGLGLGVQVVPVLLEAGLEGSVHTISSIESKGAYSGTNYDGEAKTSLSRAGGYVKFYIPGLNVIPVLGIFAYPTIHAGTQTGFIEVDGTARLFGSGQAFDGRRAVQGSYALLGFPNYLGPLFIEPALGVQHIFIPGALDLGSVYDAQIALGVSF